MRFYYSKIVLYKPRLNRPKRAVAKLSKDSRLSLGTDEAKSLNVSILRLFSLSKSAM